MGTGMSGANGLETVLGEIARHFFIAQQRAQMAFHFATISGDQEIAARFKDRPVVVLGMNTDANVEDAKVVVGKMNLNYTNLKATGLPEKYKIQVFPTLLVIDQEGIVRDVRVGYSPTLKEEVVQAVERALKARR